MIRLILLIFTFFTGTILNAQKQSLKFDILAGLHKPAGSLDIENMIGWRLGGGLRYVFSNKSSINILQINHDAFTEATARDNIDQQENGKESNTLSILTGYSYQVIKKIYVGANIGVGFVGHDKVDRTTKFGISPSISFEPFRNVFIDCGYPHFFGGYRQTNYVSFNLRYSF